MCFPKVTKQKSIEEIIAEASAGMTLDQKAQFAYELDLKIHGLLTNVLGVEVFTIDFAKFWDTARAQYPTLAETEVPDATFTITTEAWMLEILEADWTNKVPYVAEVGDCDKFATRLYIHMCDYYGISGVVEVWGQTTSGYHGFNLTVLKQGDGYIARLIEPQTDALFIEQGPLGIYRPDKVVKKLAILKL